MNCALALVRPDGLRSGERRDPLRLHVMIVFFHCVLSRLDVLGLMDDMGSWKDSYAKRRALDGIEHINFLKRAALLGSSGGYTMSFTILAFSFFRFL